MDRSTARRSQPRPNQFGLRDLFWCTTVIAVLCFLVTELLGLALLSLLVLLGVFLILPLVIVDTAIRLAQFAAWAGDAVTDPETYRQIIRRGRSWYNDRLSD